MSYDVEDKDIRDINKIITSVQNAGEAAKVNTDDLVAKLKELQAGLREKGKEVIGQTLAGFFAKYPQVVAICWNQYIPYFNDGDVCEFRLGDVFYLPSEQELGSAYEAEELDGEDEAFSTYRKYDTVNDKYVKRDNYEDTRMTKEFAEDIDSVNAALSCQEDVLESVFGSHSFVYVTRDGVKVEEYTEHY